MRFPAVAVLFSLVTRFALGQGTSAFDQQSSTEGNYLEGGADIQQSQLIGQSFTPQLSNVGFIRLFVYNGLLGNTTRATVYLNLRTDSINGSILSSSTPVLIPGGSLFSGPVDFVFSSPVPVTPGSTYYFQPFVQDNNNVGINQGPYGYSGGAAFFQGVADPNSDLWFREGIVVVPEPSAAALGLTGLVILFLARRRLA